MFLQLLPSDLLERIAVWPSLKQWERREIGQELRRMGLSYREISAVIPVHKGTLSGWCADVELTAEQAFRLTEKRQMLESRRRLGAARRVRARLERAAIRSAAQHEAIKHIADPAWVAGVVAYWSEGTKGKELHFANSDGELVTLFMNWAHKYLDVSIDRFTIALHLHSGQAEGERRAFWSDQTGIPLTQFRKTFIKPEGTGHRKNHLYAGTASVRVARSGPLLQRVLGWIDALRTYRYPADLS